MSRIVFELFGADGAAPTIAVELALAGAARITVVNRRIEPARELAELIAGRTGAQARRLPWLPRHRVDKQCGIVVNATAIGLFPDVGAMPDLDLDSLRPGMVVADVIANPPRTALIEAAAMRGCIPLDRLGMLPGGQADSRCGGDADCVGASVRGLSRLAISMHWLASSRGIGPQRSQGGRWQLSN